MIVLDTHVWLWWVHGDERLTSGQIELLDGSAEQGLGVSIISCWEVAKLVEHGRLRLPEDLEKWLAQALGYPGVRLVELSPQVVVESTRLPGTFHRDPADQLIVATARVHGCELATADRKLLAYEHVETLRMGS